MKYQASLALVKYSVQFSRSLYQCLRQHGICLFELAFVKAVPTGALQRIFLSGGSKQ
jgi:hypothetical protein